MGWLVRLAIVAAIIAPLAAFEDCAFRSTILPFAGAPAWCAAPPFSWGYAPIPIDPLVTPPMIVPEWHMLPLYGVLRAFTFDIGPLNSKILGLIATYGAFVAPFVLVFFKWSATPARAWFSLLGLGPVLVGLGWAGLQPWEDIRLIAPLLTLSYFALWLAAFPLLARKRRRVDADTFA